MAENLSSSPVFADRYRFEPVGDDWDTGRSGFTHLVYDLKMQRWGVIKRADTNSKDSTEGLKNEIRALKRLKGFGVPKVYDIGQAVYGSKNYYYVVIEFINGLRVEKSLDSLSVTERAKILTQFFNILTHAHSRGVINGDIDLKHLFWREKKRLWRVSKQLIVIDWGNAKTNVDPKKKAEFAYDLARSAEIVYSLVTRNGHPSAGNSLALPADSDLFPGMAPVPNQFQNLCIWAPRTPTDGYQSPHTASQLLEAAKDWQKALQSAKPYKKTRQSSWGFRLVLGIIAVVAVYLVLAPNSPLNSILFQRIFTSTTTSIATDTASPSTTEIETTPAISTSPLTATPTEKSTLLSTLTPSLTFTPKSATTPNPLIYTNLTPMLLFDINHPITPTPDADSSITPDTPCWENKIGYPFEARTTEGLSRRSDGYWRYGVAKERPMDGYIQVNLMPCFEHNKVSAMGMNVWIPKLEPNREFGFFVENQKYRREYTIQIGSDKFMYLHVHEKDKKSQTDTDNESLVLVVNPDNIKSDGAYPRPSYSFPIQFFFEINNNGFDIIYMLEGPLQKSLNFELLSNPSQMIRIDFATRSSIGNVEEIGLIGYGGETQTVIWPLVFFSN